MTHSLNMFVGQKMMHLVSSKFKLDPDAPKMKDRAKFVFHLQRAYHVFIGHIGTWF